MPCAPCLHEATGGVDSVPLLGRSRRPALQAGRLAPCRAFPMPRVSPWMPAGGGRGKVGACGAALLLKVSHPLRAWKTLLRQRHPAHAGKAPSSTDKHPRGGRAP
jgi:hypothetical protein